PSKKMKRPLSTLATSPCVSSYDEPRLEEYFSKHALRAGEYDGIDPASIDRGSLGGYCHWLARARLDEVEPIAAR
ncbi:MAG: hypothetical protein VB141_02230, partial [Burkholderia gladioli]